MSSFGLRRRAIWSRLGNGASRGGWGLTLAGLALGVALSGTARAQDAAGQEPSSQQGPSAQQATPPAAQQQPQRPKPKYAPQDADKPPYASDYPAPPPGAGAHAPSPDQYDPDQDGGPDGEQNGPDQSAPGANVPARPNDYPQGAPKRQGGGRGPNYPNNAQYPARPTEPPPPTLTIPAGTVITVRMNETLSSDHNQVGDRVTATLQKSIIADGWVVARRGQTLTGQVEAAQKAGRVKGTSQLGIELTDLTVVNGQQVPILTQLWKASGGTTHGADAATIGSTTALGAALGAAADWGRGAAIGAGAGAAAGIGAVLLTRGRPTIVPAEAQLTFRLVDPVKVDTTTGQQAFLPARQSDYDGPVRGRYDAQGDYGSEGPQGATPYAYGGPYFVYPGYAYAAPYPYYYPGFYGFYGWGFGPRFYGGFHRGFVGHGFVGHGGFHR
jgi:hypothetical protein